MSTVDFFSLLDDIKRHDILHDTARQYPGHFNDSPHSCQHGNHKNCCESLINTQFYRWLRAYRKCFSFSADVWHFGMRTALPSAFKLYVVQFREQKNGMCELNKETADVGRITDKTTLFRKRGYSFHQLLNISVSIVPFFILKENRNYM